MLSSFGLKPIFFQKKIVLILLAFSSLFQIEASNCFAQENKTVLRGTIKALETIEVIPYANVYCKETKQGTSANLQGFFYIDNLQGKTSRLIISSIGYVTLDTLINLKENTTLNFFLKEKELTLDEVIVIAKEKQTIETTSEITSDALKHLQPNSFADILELLPGGISTNRSMQSARLIALREPINASSYSSRNNENNSSLGTSFVIDGIPLSNDGMLSNVTGAPSIGGSWEASIAPKNTTGRGIDMRTLSTDDIKKVEIIRGIPSVSYGDLSSGLVKIQRSYETIPLGIRFKANPSTRLFAIGKGYALSKHTFNINFDYLDYKADPRDKKKIMEEQLHL